MSDNWIILIPEDPRAVPAAERQERAQVRFAKLAPDADSIESVVEDGPQLVDCGGNFGRISCPACHAEISLDWWQEHMDLDYDGVHFRMLTHYTPCCAEPRTLNALTYEWPLGFARYSLSAMNPELGKLRDEVRQEFETILDTPLRVVYRHI